MSRTWIVISVATLLIAAMPVQAESDTDDGWTFSTGLDARLRYEFVDVDGAANEANAVTIRTRLSFAATRDNFGTLFELEDVRGLGSNRYNSTANGMGSFPVVADPDATELNRAFLSYATPGDVMLKAGRQKIVRDRGRFIGDVGWRQNQQTFDAFTVARDDGTFRFWFAYLAGAKRIFGDQHPNPVNREFDLDSYAAEAEVRFDPGTLTGIAHYLDFENDMGRSHRNTGLRWLGAVKAGDDAKVAYRLEYMDQAPHENGNSINEAEYYAFEAAYKTKGWGIGINYELLGGDGVYGFQRPLATLHAYNGWADQFLGTPPEGLQDLFLTGNVKVGAYKIGGQYHRFDSDEGSIHFADELGLVVSRKCRNKFDVMLKYANHMAKDAGVDVSKVWVSVRFADKFEVAR